MIATITRHSIVFVVSALLGALRYFTNSLANQEEVCAPTHGSKGNSFPE
jgi:hypothetical protein